LLYYFKGGIPMESAEAQQTPIDTDTAQESAQESAQEMPASHLEAGLMECPVCGHPMPDLKGGKATICPACGYKDSCCY
jgi:membrane protease subunit (stomatin/prohibitin family)